MVKVVSIFEDLGVEGQALKLNNLAKSAPSFIDAALSPSFEPGLEHFELCALHMQPKNVRRVPINDSVAWI